MYQLAPYEDTTVKANATDTEFTIELDETDLNNVSSFTASIKVTPQDGQLIDAAQADVFFSQNSLQVTQVTRGNLFGSDDQFWFPPTIDNSDGQLLDGAWSAASIDTNTPGYLYNISFDIVSTGDVSIQLANVDVDYNAWHNLTSIITNEIGEDILQMSFSNESPSNNSIVTNSSNRIQIDIDHFDDEPMTLIWYSNVTGEWRMLGYNDSCTDGTYDMSPYGTVDSPYDQVVEYSFTDYNATSHIYANNSCPGNPLGSISAISIVATGDASSKSIRPKYTERNITGDLVSFSYYPVLGKSYAEITDDSYAPTEWTWQSIKNLALWTSAVFNDPKIEITYDMNYGSDFTYYWRVFAYDAGSSINETYQYYYDFGKPYIDAVSPTDGSLISDLDITLSTTVRDNQGDEMTISFWEKQPDDTWEQVGADQTGYNGTYEVNKTYEPSQEVYIKVIAEDAIHASEKIYRFDTRELYIPTNITNITATIAEYDTVNKNTKIDLTWNKDNYTSHTIIKCMKYRYPIQSDPEIYIIYNGTGTTYTHVSDVENGESCYYSFWGYNETDKWISDNKNTSFINRPQLEPVNNLTCNITKYDTIEHDTHVNITWEKGTCAERTIIAVNETGYPSFNDGSTIVYNGTGTKVTHESEIKSGETYYYSAWSYNETDALAHETREICSVSRPALTDAYLNVIITDISDYPNTDIYMDVSRYPHTDKTMVKYNKTSIPTLEDNSPVIFNSSALTYVDTLTMRISLEYERIYFKAWAWNETDNCFIVDGTEDEIEKDPLLPVSSFTATRDSVVPYPYIDMNISWTSCVATDTTLVKRSMSGYPTFGDGSTVVYNSGGNSFNETVECHIGETYYYSAWTYNTTETIWNLTTQHTQNGHHPLYKVSNFQTIVQDDNTTVNLSWNTDEHTDYVRIKRSYTDFPTFNDSSTEIFNNTQLETQDTVSLGIGEGAYYSAWTYNTTENMWNYEAAHSIAIRKPLAPADIHVAAYEYSGMNVSWTMGTGADSTVIVRNTQHTPTTPSDGTVVYDGGGTTYNDSNNIQGNTTYHYSAFSKTTIEGFSVYSDNYVTDSNATEVGPPVIITGEATGVLADNATLAANLTLDGGDPTTCGFFVYEAGSLLYNISTGAYGTGSHITYQIDNLNDTTTYSYQAWAINAHSMAVGVNETFTTINGTPDITTLDITDINVSGATLHARLTFDGYESATCGFFWGNSTQHTNVSKGDFSAVANISHQLLNLEGSVQYYVQAWAYNKHGFSVGDNRTFLTKVGAPIGTEIIFHNDSFNKRIIQDYMWINFTKDGDSTHTYIVMDENGFITDRDEGTLIYHGEDESFEYHPEKIPYTVQRTEAHTAQTTSTTINCNYDSTYLGSYLYKAIYGSRKGAQTFTVGYNGLDEDYYLESVNLKLYRLNNPGLIKVQIINASYIDGMYYDRLDADTYQQLLAPTGDHVLAEQTVNSLGVNASTPADWFTIELDDPVTVRKGYTYALIVSAPNGDENNRLYWSIDPCHSAYHGGDPFYSTNNGDSWSEIYLRYSTRWGYYEGRADYNFELYGVQSYDGLEHNKTYFFTLWGYVGKDPDNDSIGEVPYNTSGTNYEDIHPLMDPHEMENNPVPLGGLEDPVLYVNAGGGTGYTTIQSAIDAATEGQRIFVYPGTYAENITINKSVILIGRNQDSTIINGNNSTYVVTFEENQIVFDGFTVKNSNEGGAGLFIDSDSNIIRNNTVTENGRSITINGFKTGNYIYKNNFYNNEKSEQDDGINFWYDANEELGNYWDAYVADIVSHNYSESYITQQITTYPIVPEVKGTGVINITDDSAAFTAELITNYGENCTVGFSYGTSSGTYTHNTTAAGTYNAGDTIEKTVTDLEPGRTWYYKAWANNNGGYTEDFERTFITKPAGASSLSISNWGARRLNLSWSAENGSDSYRVVRKEGSFPLNMSDGIIRYTGENTSLVDSYRSGDTNPPAINQSTTYYYRIWSYNETNGLYSEDYASNVGTTGTNQSIELIDPEMGASDLNISTTIKATSHGTGTINLTFCNARDLNTTTREIAGSASGWSNANGITNPSTSWYSYPRRQCNNYGYYYTINFAYTSASGTRTSPAVTPKLTAELDHPKLISGIQFSGGKRIHPTSYTQYELEGSKTWYLDYHDYYADEWKHASHSAPYGQSYIYLDDLCVVDKVRLWMESTTSGEYRIYIQPRVNYIYFLEPEPLYETAITDGQTASYTWDDAADLNTNYYWTVTSDDGQNVLSSPVRYFKTEDILFTNVTPEHEGEVQNTQHHDCSVDITSTSGSTMGIKMYSYDNGYNLEAEYTGGNDTYNFTFENTNQFSETYYWKVVVEDEPNTVEEIYSFSVRDTYHPATPGASLNVINATRIDIENLNVDGHTDSLLIRWDTTTYPGRDEGNLTGNFTTFTDKIQDGLLANTQYYFSLWCWNETDELWSSRRALSATTEGPLEPQFDLIVVNATRIQIANIDGNDYITSFLIKYNTTGYPMNPNEGIELWNNSDGSHYHTGLDSLQKYYYSVWGWDEEHDCWSPRNSKNATTEGPVAPTYYLEVINATQINVKGITGNEYATHYMIRYKKNAYPTNRSDGTLLQNSTETSYNHTGLQSLEDYYYHVWAWDDVHNVWSLDPEEHHAETEGPGPSLGNPLIEVDTYGKFALNLTFNRNEYVDAVYLRWSTSGYPIDRTDGLAVTPITNVTGNQTYHTGLQYNQQYNYSAWCYNETYHVWSPLYTGSGRTQKEPEIMSVTPGNGSTNVDLQTTLSVTVEDINNDQLDIEFLWKNGTTWETIGTKDDVYAGTHTVNAPMMHTPLTWYNWSVHIFDGDYWANQTQMLKTVSINAPTDFIATQAGTYPEDVELNWVNNPDAQRTVIVRKKNSEPTSPFDGTVLFNGTGTVTYDLDLYDQGTVYFYRAYSYLNSGFGGYAETKILTKPGALAQFNTVKNDQVSLDLDWSYAAGSGANGVLILIGEDYMPTDDINNETTIYYDTNYSTNTTVDGLKSGDYLIYCTPQGENNTMSKKLGTIGFEASYDGDETTVWELDDVRDGYFSYTFNGTINETDKERDPVQRFYGIKLLHKDFYDAEGLNFDAYFKKIEYYTDGWETLWEGQHNNSGTQKEWWYTNLTRGEIQNTSKVRVYAQTYNIWPDIYEVEYGKLGYRYYFKAFAVTHKENLTQYSLLALNNSERTNESPDNNVPYISNPYPSDGATSVQFSNNETYALNFSIEVSDKDNDGMEVYFDRLNGSTWEQFGMVTNVSNGTVYHESTAFTSFNQTYQWRVRVKDDAEIGGSVWQSNWNTSETYAFSTRDALNPQPPAPFTASLIGLRTIHLEWTPGMHGDKTHITMRAGTDPLNRTDGTNVYYDTGISTDISDLDPETTYYFGAWGYNETDNVYGDTYEVIDITTGDNREPTIDNEQPVHGATGIDRAQPAVICNIEDLDGDDMQWQITGEYVQNAGGTMTATNGTINALLNTPLPPETTIEWSVAVFDGYNWTNETFTFTTSQNAGPLLSFFDPPNGASGVATTLDEVSVFIVDQEGDSINCTIHGDPTYFDENQTIGTNGTYRADVLQTLPVNQTYYWYVNASDGVSWTNMTCVFSTSNNTSPDVATVSTVESKTGFGKNYTSVYNVYLNVSVSDPDGNDLDVSYYLDGRKIGEVHDVMSGSIASLNTSTCTNISDWFNTSSGQWEPRNILNHSMTHTWYVAVSDGVSSTTSESWQFNTSEGSDLYEDGDMTLNDITQRLIVEWYYTPEPFSPGGKIDTDIDNNGYVALDDLMAFTSHWYDDRYYP